MVSLEERLQIKREPLDKWSVREKLCLVSAVIRSGDQNWMSVSRALRHFAEPNRPADWFHQKNCASQYGALLETVETPKRKKRNAQGESVIETPAEFLLRKLTAERLAELKILLAEEKTEYQRLQEDMRMLESGEATEEQVDRWCKEIDEEEERKEQEALAHAKWLKERELRKQEIERAWRPTVKVVQPGLKKKVEEVDGENVTEEVQLQLQQQHQQEHAKPALSPLLTSLLKSPSQVSNPNTSILHTAITSQRNATNTAIASLLNSTASIVQQPNFQHLQTVPVVQEAQNAMVTNIEEAQFLEDAVDALPNLKVEDIESTILAGNDPLPVMKTDEVEVIISDLMDHVDDIVSHPEQHIKVDGNEDIITHLENELKELCEKEEEEEKQEQNREMKVEVTEEELVEEQQIEEIIEMQDVGGKEQLQEENEIVIDDGCKKEEIKVDPFEFEEDPEIYEPSKPSLYQNQKQLDQKPDEEVKETAEEVEETVEEEEEELPDITFFSETEKKPEVKEEKQVPVEKEVVPGSVEIVEVMVMEDEEDEKQLNKSQIQDIVHSQKIEPDTSEENSKDEKSEETQDSSTDAGASENDNLNEVVVEIKKEEPDTKGIDVDDSNESRRNTFTPDFSEEFYDDMELTKIDKSVKAKRDYSRTKKKEEKDFDILLAIEKAVNERMDEADLPDDGFSDRELDSEKKPFDIHSTKIKSETERSNSPWTEEEDTKSKRRYSTPATPVDSVPSSPASSSTYCPEDEKEYRNWKKSVMLLYGRIAAHKFASVFLKPITEEQAPGYHSLIYRPMDLLTIRRHIESGVIKTTAEFQRDVLLMFTNAIMYNKCGTVVYDMARDMQQECAQMIQTFIQAQTQADMPVTRRETRTSEPANKRKRMSEDLRHQPASKKKKED